MHGPGNLKCDFVYSLFTILDYSFPRHLAVAFFAACNQILQRCLGVFSRLLLFFVGVVSKIAHARNIFPSHPLPRVWCTTMSVWEFSVAITIFVGYRLIWVNYRWVESNGWLSVRAALGIAEYLWNWQLMGLRHETMLFCVGFGEVYKPNLCAPSPAWRQAVCYWWRRENQSDCPRKTCMFLLTEDATFRIL